MDRNVEAVAGKLRARSRKGVDTYGVTTERTDLSHADWLRHLQEELLDGAVYIEKLLGEMKGEGDEEGK